MEYSFGSRMKHAWNVFMGRDSPNNIIEYIGAGSSYRVDRPRLSRGNNQTILGAIYNRIAIDASSVDIRHVRLDDEGQYLEDIDSELNNLFKLEANIDQAARAFKHDIYLSMIDEGSIAIVPIETDGNPDKGTFKIYSARVGRIVDWYPKHVRVECYDERDGQKKEIVVPKKTTAIVENPFYNVMNENRSIMQRLSRKLALLDAIDEQSSSGKLDLIVQLPYVVKSDARREQAEKRRKDIEEQLTGSKYGIAYTDGSERITQLNRPVENNLMKQVEYLTSMLYSQLGITQGIMDGSANEAEMNNYYIRTIEPLVTAVVEELRRKFLIQTARTQKQSIEFFRDRFKLIPLDQLAEIGDKFTRNEIATSNDIRQIIGWRPSSNPRANELKNKNLRDDQLQLNQPSNNEVDITNPDPEEEIQNG